MKVLDWSLVPPGGWRYADPSGVTFSGPTLAVLAERVKSYRSSNGMPFDRDGWEGELCSQMGLGGTQCGEPPPPPREGRVVGLHDLNRFAQTMLEWVGAGGSTVPQEEAERRAEICATCPENLQLRGCVGCFTVINAVVKLLGKSTSRDKDLESCNVCGCTLRAKVHVPEEVMHATPQPRKPWPDHCWMA